MLSVVLATKNEGKNIGGCLESVKSIADEIIVFDEFSTDDTRNIAKKYGAKVYKFQHKVNFHETKQKAIDTAKGDWILQMDADERVTPKLAQEILEVINKNSDVLIHRHIKIFKANKLFQKHSKIMTQRDGLNFETGEIVAFMIPRLNYFIGKPLRHAGVYPDPAIRLIRKGKAYLPAKSVHEVMKVSGRVSWLTNYMEHHDSPTLARYLARANRYTTETAGQLKELNVPKNTWQLFNYTIIKPKLTFLKLYFRHRGYKDGVRGFLWSAFSAWHWPLAYWKYWIEID